MADSSGSTSPGGSHLNDLLLRLTTYSDCPRLKKDVKRLLGLKKSVFDSFFGSDSGKDLPWDLIPAVVSVRNANWFQLSGTVMLRSDPPQPLYVRLWLPPEYPSGFPSVVVVPGSNKRIRSRHPHVGVDGKCYLPYISSWDAKQSTLEDLLDQLRTTLAAFPPLEDGVAEYPTANSPDGVAERGPSNTSLPRGDSMVNRDRGGGGEPRERDRDRDRERERGGDRSGHASSNTSITRGDSMVNRAGGAERERERERDRERSGGGGGGGRLSVDASLANSGQSRRVNSLAGAAGSPIPQTGSGVINWSTPPSHAPQGNSGNPTASAALARFRVRTDSHANNRSGSRGGGNNTPPNMASPKREQPAPRPNLEITQEAEAAEEPATIPGTECVICLEMKKSAFFMPCGHVSCCRKCAKSIQQCPICRCQIEKVLKAFI